MSPPRSNSARAGGASSWSSISESKTVVGNQHRSVGALGGLVGDSGRSPGVPSGGGGGVGGAFSAEGGGSTTGGGGGGAGIANGGGGGGGGGLMSFIFGGQNNPPRRPGQMVKLPQVGWHLMRNYSLANNLLQM